MITVPIFARLLSTDEYGILSIYLSYEQIILTLSTWEVSLSAYQRGIYRYKDDIVFFTTTTQIFANTITIVFFGIVAIFWNYFCSLTLFTPKLVILLFIYMILQPAYSCWIIKKRSSFDYKEAVSATLIYSIVNVIAPILAIIIITPTAEVKFEYTLISSIFFYLYFYCKNVKVKQVVKRFHLLKEQFLYLLKFQAPIVIHALSYTILAQADRVMIGKMVGNSQAAFYSVAYALGSVVSIIHNSINQALVPWRFEKLENKKYKEIRQSTNYLIVLIAGIVVLFVFVAPEIMRILFPEDYYEAIWCIPPIALSVYFMFLYSLFVWVENYYEKTKYVAYVSVSCAIINIILNTCLINAFGYIACAYTTVVSYMLFCLGHYYFMKKVCREVNVTENIYDIKCILVISIITSIAIIGIMALYTFVIVRYLIIVFVCLLLLVKCTIIINMSKNMQ